MFFDQFHETKSRHLSSEPLTALKKNSYLNFHEISQKNLLLPRILLFMNLNVILWKPQSFRMFTF